MEQVNFKIKEVIEGWFDVEFSKVDNKIIISASSAWGNDSPKYFLEMISECLLETQFNKYVVFDEEPGTYIIHIEKKQTVILTILYSEFDDDNWTKLDLQGDLSINHIKQYIPIDKMILKCEIDFSYFVKTIHRAFDEYFKGEKLKEYEDNWMEFPKIQFEKLSKLLESIS